MCAPFLAVSIEILHNGGLSPYSSKLFLQLATDGDV